MLGLLAERPSHGFALAQQLAPHGELGRILTVRRPLVYRALERLVEAGWAVPVRTEPGEAGPRRTVFRITPTGRRTLRSWLAQPVEHVRDLRIAFLVKLALHHRLGSSSSSLVQAQTAALEPALSALEALRGADLDEVSLWRRHIARAAAAFLHDLDQIGHGREGS